MGRLYGNNFLTGGWIAYIYDPVDGKLADFNGTWLYWPRHPPEVGGGKWWKPWCGSSKVRARGNCPGEKVGPILYLLDQVKLPVYFILLKIKCDTKQRRGQLSSCNEGLF